MKRFNTKPGGVLYIILGEMDCGGRGQNSNSETTNFAQVEYQASHCGVCSTVLRDMRALWTNSLLVFDHTSCSWPMQWGAQLMNLWGTLGHVMDAFPEDGALHHSILQVAQWIHVYIHTYIHNYTYINIHIMYTCMIQMDSNFSYWIPIFVWWSFFKKPKHPSDIHDLNPWFQP